MDLATIIGLAVSAILVIAAIVLGGSPIMFVDPPSALIVLGGTIGSTLIQNPLADVLTTAKVVGKAFSAKTPSTAALIDEIVTLSRRARKEGMLALESAPVSYEFLKKAVSLCVDGVEIGQMREILTTDIQATSVRHKRGAQILLGMASAAPAFGMIGTLIGLVQMLASLDDPSSIGPAMAVALLTTLYGALLANVVCLPMAEKLKVRSQEELMAMTICIEGCVGLSQGDNPGAIDQKLKSFLAPKLRDTGEKKAA
ncbi:MAG: flagellar motor protein PomA [Acidobacteria bacterium]|nr:flagellar motor protein PomA [Acidobacteriota bacterium]